MSGKTKKLLAVCFVALLAAGFNLKAATFWKGTVDDDWNNASNWSNGVPGDSDVYAVFRTDLMTRDCVIAAQPTGGAFNYLSMSHLGGTSNIDHNAGTLTVNNWTQIARYATGTSYYRLNDGTFSGSGYIAVGMAGTGYMDIASAGAVDINNDIFIANSSGSAGTLNLAGGSIAADFLVVGKGGTGTFNMNGGTVNLSGALTFGNQGGNGSMNLYAGTVNALSIGKGDTGTLALDIEEGVINLSPDLSAEEDPLAAWGDFKTRIESYNITGYGDSGLVNYSWDDQNYTGTISAVPEPATLLIFSIGAGFILRKRK